MESAFESLETGMLTITLATHNEGKRKELLHRVESSRLPVRLVINAQAPEVEETGNSFLENAMLKASQSPPVPGSKLVLAEDSGIVVDALDGSFGISPFPGIYSNRWLTPERRDALLGQSHPNRMPLDRTQHGITKTDLCLAILKLLEGRESRTARYCCGMVLWHGERGKLFETLESTELRIIDSKPRGMNGFGYDPITLPIGEARTMAELTPDEKNRISHRGKAFDKLLDFLRHNENEFA